jgi:CBS domain-containing protein
MRRRAGKKSEFFCFESLVECAIFGLVMAVAGTVGVILARKDSAVWSISPNATVFEAIQLMAEKNVGALPVVDSSRLVGIISERDYTRKVILKGRSSKDTPVSDIMTRELLTASPSDSIAECMRIMTEKRVRHLPVLEGTKISGIVSIGDVLKWFISAQAATIDNLERYVTGDYPA